MYETKLSTSKSRFAQLGPSTVRTDRFPPNTESDGGTQNQTDAVSALVPVLLSRATEAAANRQQAISLLRTDLQSRFRRPASPETSTKGNAMTLSHPAITWELIQAARLRKNPIMNKIDPDQDVPKNPKLRPRSQASPAPTSTPPPPVPTETREVRFKRIAGLRMRHALHDVDLLKRLASQPGYIYTEAQVAQMLGALRAAVDSLEEAFNPQPKPEQKLFQFDETESGPA